MKPLWITACDTKFQPMAEAHFLPSFFGTGLATEFELHFSDIKQPYGDFGTQEYNVSYAAELKRIAGILERNRHRRIVWSDSDLRFYRNFTDDIRAKIETHDFCACQDSPTELCTGLQFFQVTERILRFFDDWIRVTEQGQPDGTPWAYAQVSFNHVLSNTAGTMRIGKLDRSYWTVGLDLGAKLWSAGDPLPEPPADLKVHHANFTKGFENKMALLEAVRRRMDERQRILLECAA